MPDRIGNWLTGVDFKQPEIIRVVLLRALIQFLCVTVSTPDGCTVLCSRKDWHLG